jgi:hypothetical protein
MKGTQIMASSRFSAPPLEEAEFLLYDGDRASQLTGGGAESESRRCSRYWKAG